MNAITKKMKTHRRTLLFALTFIGCCTIPVVAGEQMIFTGSNQHALQFIQIPDTAKVMVDGNPTNDPNSYIWGVNPVQSFYHTSSEGPVNFEGIIVQAGNYQFEQQVGSNGYVCTHVNILNTPGFGGDGYFLAGGIEPYDQKGISVGRLSIRQSIHDIFGVEPDSKVDDWLDEGCVGVARIAMRVPNGSGGWDYPSEKPTPGTNPHGFPELHGDPNKFGTIHAFLTLEAALAYPSCGQDTHQVILVKYGIWKTGSAPPPNPDGTIDLDSVAMIENNEEHNFDYMVLQSNNRWLNMNKGVSLKKVQQGIPVEQQRTGQWLKDFGVLAPPSAGCARAIYKACVPNNPLQ